MNRVFDDGYIIVEALVSITIVIATLATAISIGNNALSANHRSQALLSESQILEILPLNGARNASDALCIEIETRNNCWVLLYGEGGHLQSITDGEVTIEFGSNDH